MGGGIWDPGKNDMKIKVLDPTPLDKLPATPASWFAQSHTNCLFRTQTHKQSPPHQKRLSLAHLVDRGDNIFDMFAPSGCLFLVHSTHYFCHPHLYLQRQPACRVFRCHGWGQNVGWHTRKFFMHNPRDKDVLS